MKNAEKIVFRCFQMKESFFVLMGNLSGIFQNC